MLYNECMVYLLTLLLLLGCAQETCPSDSEFGGLRKPNVSCPTGYKWYCTEGEDGDDYVLLPRWMCKSQKDGSLTLPPEMTH